MHLFMTMKQIASCSYQVVLTRFVLTEMESGSQRVIVHSA